MKKHSRIIFVMAACLAGFIGQSGALAASTNSVWSLNAVSSLSAGKIKDAETNAATATFLSDGTFGLLVGSSTLNGTYTNTTKSLTMTFSTNSVVALESNAYDFVTSLVPSEITITISKIGKLSKIQLKDGVPVKATAKISGKGSETVSGKTKSKSFSVTDLLIDWTVVSGGF